MGKKKWSQRKKPKPSPDGSGFSESVVVFRVYQPSDEDAGFGLWVEVHGAAGVLHVGDFESGEGALAAAVSLQSLVDSLADLYPQPTKGHAVVAAMCGATCMAGGSGIQKNLPDLPVAAGFHEHKPSGHDVH